MADAAPASKKRAAEDSEAPAKKVKKDDAPAAIEPVDAATAEVTTVYVGGLSWNVDNEWLKSELEVCGEVVSARVVTDRETQKSRGFGYVEFVKAESAQKALEMAGQEIDGRAIKVDLSLPRAPKEGGAFGDKPKKVFNDQLSGPPTTTLFVGNLPFSATEDAVWSAFADFGDVSSVSPIHPLLPRTSH
jgi:nucleolin